MKQSYLAFAMATLTALSGCGGGSNSPVSGGGPITTIPASVTSTQGAGYTLSAFAQAPGTLRPDDLLQMGSTVFVVYQDNNINPDGTLAPGVTSAQSEVIEYDMNGNVLSTFKVPGHPDGLVAYNATTVWVSSNEDANPLIISIDTTNNTMTVLTSDVPTLPHGGGLDDMKQVGNVIYASASNPTLTTSPTPNLAPYSTDASGATAEYGVSTVPAIYAITANSDGTTFHATPVVTSSSPATLLPDQTPVALNMTDPDASAIDPSGDLVTVSQQDSELVFVQNIAGGSPKISVLPLTLYGNPWPVDDVRWPPASGSSFMLLSDNKAQFVYRIDATSGFNPKSAYAAGQGTLLKVDPTTGIMTPLYVGMNTPHGLIFIKE